MERQYARIEDGEITEVIGEERLFTSGGLDPRKYIGIPTFVADEARGVLMRRQLLLRPLLVAE